MVAAAVSIALNGERWQLAAACSVTQLLRELGLDEDAVAVERNRCIVARSHWASTRIESGDSVEIVRFVGGG